MPMKPTTMFQAPFPVYAIQPISKSHIAISGGGGTMKSGIPNGLNVYDVNGTEFVLLAESLLDNAPLSLCLRNVDASIITAAGKNMRQYLFTDCNMEVVDDPDLPFDYENMGYLSISGDGRRVALSSEPNQIRIFSYPYFVEMARFSGHKQSINGIDFSKDGKLVVSCSVDRSCILWDPSTGNEIKRLEAYMKLKYQCPGAHIRFAKFHPNSSILILGETTAEDGAYISAWKKCSDTQWEYIAHKKVLKDPMTAICLSGSGGAIAVGSAEGHIAVVLLDLEASYLSMLSSTESWFKSKPIHNLPVTAVCITGDGRRIISAAPDSSCALFKTEEEAEGVDWWFIFVVACLAILVSLLYSFYLNDGMDVVVEKLSWINDYL